MVKNLVRNIDVKKISNNDLSNISKIEKDMWAFWLWEYVKCNCCNKIHSKNDIFWHLSSEIRRESVTKLEEIYLWDSIKCKICNSTNTEFIYDIDANIKSIIDRYKEQAFLVVSYNDLWDIIWFCDWYISDFASIFSKDISSHYWKYNILDIESKIKDTLNLEVLNKLLYFSSLWMYEKYVNYIFIYELLRGFFRSIEVEDSLIWITELDKNNSLYKIYQMMWSISIWIEKSLVSNVGINYDSDICVFPDPINDFKTKYDLNFRELVRNYKIK